MQKTGASLKSLCILYTDAKLEDEVVDEQEYFNEDLEGLFTRIERLLLQSSLAYGDVCYLLDQVLNEYDKENNIESVEKFVKKILVYLDGRQHHFRNAEDERSDISLEQPEKKINHGHVNAQNKLDEKITTKWNRRHRVSSIDAIKQNEVILLKKKNADLLAEIEKMKLEKVKAAMLGMPGRSMEDKGDATVSSANKQGTLLPPPMTLQVPPPLPGKPPPPASIPRLTPPLPVPDYIYRGSEASTTFTRVSQASTTFTSSEASTTYRAQPGLHHLYRAQPGLHHLTGGARAPPPLPGAVGSSTFARECPWPSSVTWTWAPFPLGTRGPPPLPGMMNNNNSIQTGPPPY